MPAHPDNAACRWPGFHADSLLLPLADDGAWPAAPALELDGLRLQRKHEFHVTLLNRSLGASLREHLGDAAIRDVFTALPWAPRATGQAHLLRKAKRTAAGVQHCASLIERLDLPALAAFRSALARQAGIALPEVLPHVTLYVTGDPDGIGLPDLAAFRASRVADLHLPSADEVAPPPLDPGLLAAYRATDYVLTRPPATLHVGESSPALDAELDRHGATRAIVITACNPWSQILAPADNAMRMQLLHHELQAAGHPTSAAEGRDRLGQWPAEASLLAIGTTPAQDDSLLHRYGQHALVAIERGQPARLVLHPETRCLDE